MSQLSLFLLTCALSLAGQVNGRSSMSVAILHLRNYSKYARICASFQNTPGQSTFPTTLSQSEENPIVIIPPTEGCDVRTAPHNATAATSKHAVFFWTGGNCSFLDRMKQAKEWGAKQVIFIIQPGHHSRGAPVIHHNRNISFPVGTVSIATWQTVLEKIGDPKWSNLYRPVKPLFDPNLIVLWVIAVATVVIGGYSGVTWPENNNNGSHGDTDSDEGIQLEDSEDGEEDEECGVPQISPIFIIVFIVMLCLVLLLLYYFYRYVVYFVIAVFAIASVSGSYFCISAVYSAIVPSCIPDCKIPERILKSQPRISTIVILVISFALSICWIIIRSEHKAWILQDILCVFLCITILHEYHLPSMKISSILLLALLLYDIFFVFITPMLTSRGKSIMIQVATGEGSKEAIPMVIKLPKFIHSAMMLCERPYSLLGLGDILVPGLFVSFCHKFDATARLPRRVYFTTGCIAYGFGLFFAFLMLVVTRSGQPALLYLSPSVLVGVTVVGVYRGELRELWDGVVYLKKSTSGEARLEEEDEEEVDEKKKLLKEEEKKEDQSLDRPGETFHLSLENEGCED